MKIHLASLFPCSTILPDTSTKSRQKTRVVKRAANPMFNHTMVYNDVRLEHLKEACVEMTVWDHDRLNNHYIGGLRLGLGTGQFQFDWRCIPFSFRRRRRFWSRLSSHLISGLDYCYSLTAGLPVSKTPFPNIFGR